MQQGRVTQTERERENTLKGEGIHYLQNLLFSSKAFPLVGMVMKIYTESSVTVENQKRSERKKQRRKKEKKR